MDIKEKQIKKNNDFIVIKLPIKIENIKKANELLGNKKELYTKIKNGEDLNFDFFYNKLTLENCFSNDILLQRKTLRNKKDKNKKKYKYSILGKITNIIQAFSLEDFIYINEEKTCLDDLQKYIVPKEMYEEEIKDKKKEIGLNEESQIVSNLIKKKYKEYNLNNGNNDEEKLENYFSFIQPSSFANYKNSSQNIPKLIKDKIEIEQFKDN